MLIGIDTFGYNDGAIFKSSIFNVGSYEMEIAYGKFDEVYIDLDTTVSTDIVKPTEWGFQTVIDAKFQGDLEGGSVSGSGQVITAIRIQRQKEDEIVWNDILQIDYSTGYQSYYTFTDKYIQNGISYRYALIPLSGNTLGYRQYSELITVDFDGVFFSDLTHNYRLYYNLELGDFEHNTPSSVQEPLNSQYPIVTYGTLDYIRGSVEALFLSASTIATNGNINIRSEKLERQELMNFMKNRKPKVLRNSDGNLLLVTIIDNPKETPNNQIRGIANVSFNFVEIGNVEDTDNLKTLGLLEGF